MPLTSPAWRYIPLQSHGQWFPYVGQKRSGGLSSDISPTGRIVQATTNGTNILLRFPTNYALTAWSETNTGIAGTRPRVRYDIVDRDATIILSYEAGGGIKRQATINEGASFSVATTITTDGQYHDSCITPTGSEVYAWRTGSGAAKVRVLSAFGTDVLPGTSPVEVTAVASGVAADTLSLVARRDASLVLSYRNGSNAIVSVVSSDSGLTWA